MPRVGPLADNSMTDFVIVCAGFDTYQLDPRGPVTSGQRDGTKQPTLVKDRNTPRNSPTDLATDLTTDLATDFFSAYSQGVLGKTKNPPPTAPPRNVFKIEIETHVNPSAQTCHWKRKLQHTGCDMLRLHMFDATRT